MRKALLGLALAVVLASPSLAEAHFFRRVVVVNPTPVVAASPVVVTSSFYTPVVQVAPAPVIVTAAPVFVPVRPVVVRYVASPVVVSPTIYVVPRQ